MSSNREALRASALKTRQPRKTIVEFDSQKYEVRAPSVKQRSEILQRAGVLDDDKKTKKTDTGRMQVAAVVFCTFDPDSGERVFENADVEALLEDEAGGIVDALSTPAIAYLNASNDKDAAKND